MSDVESEVEVEVLGHINALTFGKAFEKLLNREIEYGQPFMRVYGVAESYVEKKSISGDRPNFKFKGEFEAVCLLTKKVKRSYGLYLPGEYSDSLAMSMLRENGGFNRATVECDILLVKTNQAIPYKYEVKACSDKHGMSLLEAKRAELRQRLAIENN